MNLEPGPIKFWEGIYEMPKKRFDVNDESRLQAQYIIEHPEIKALTSMVIAHLSKKPPAIVVRPLKVMEEVGRFFTRPAELLQAEVDETLKKFGQMGARPKQTEKRKKDDDSRITRRPVFVPDCSCSDQNTSSSESFYSSFISKSTSASTMLSVTENQLVTRSTIEGAVWQLVINAFSHALNNLYAAREHDIVFDEAFLCLTACVQDAVDVIWQPRLAEINEVLDTMLADVLSISAENRKQRLLMTNKFLSKVNRLKHNFKGLTKNESHPIIRKTDIIDTLNNRKGTFNRYPKDQFGVYLPAHDRVLNIGSISYVQSSYEDREEEQNVSDITLENVSLLED